MIAILEFVILDQGFVVAEPLLDLGDTGRFGAFESQKTGISDFREFGTLCIRAIEQRLFFH